MSQSIPFAMIGAGGRMGREIIALAPSFAGGVLRLSGALERPGSELLGLDAVELTGEAAYRALPRVTLVDSPAAALSGARVAIDFSSPATTLAVAEQCASQGAALVVGTTGFSEPEKRALLAFGQRVPLLVAPNMSQGVNLLFYLTGVAAKALTGFEAEITEIHHHHKKDAPSGTAARLKEVLLESLGRSEEDVVYGRQGIGDPRPSGEIGVHALRGGDVVGEHTVFFFGEGERIELTHRATSRSTFASGALAAARFVVDREPGVYTMKDVLQITG